MVLIAAKCTESTPGGPLLMIYPTGAGPPRLDEVQTVVGAALISNTTEVLKMACLTFLELRPLRRAVRRVLRTSGER